MRMISRLVISLVSNFIALIAAAYFITGIEISADLSTLIWIAVLFTVINTFIRPIVKFLLTPFIILTLGLLTVVINAAMLWLLDFLSVHITIMGILPLIYGTIIISLVNIIIGISARSAYRR